MAAAWPGALQKHGPSVQNHSTSLNLDVPPAFVELCLRPRSCLNPELHGRSGMSEKGTLQIVQWFLRAAPRVLVSSCAAELTLVAHEEG